MITLAQEAARRAGAVLMDNFGRASLKVDTKARADYVTDVDRKAEDTIHEFLAAEAPEHGFLLEESGASGADADYVWVVDPLDGTTNYIHRFPFFAVSLALRKRGRGIIGVVYDPVRGEMFTAEDGEGTKLNGVEVTISPATDLEAALLGTGFPFRQRRYLGAYLEAFEALFLGSAGMRRAGAAALDLAYVATGRLDGFWELGLSPWDTAAGALLVTGAQGRVSDFSGGPVADDRGDIVATNGPLHDAILAVTRQAFAARIAEAEAG